MAKIFSIVAVASCVLVFTIFGIVACVKTASHFFVAVRSGVIRQDGREVTFAARPVRFVGALVHMALGFVAGLILLGVITVMIARAG